MLVVVITSTSNFWKMI